MLSYIIIGLFSIILIFTSIFTIDFLVKYIYALYWMNEYKSLFNIFFNNLKNDVNVKIRRKDKNGHYIFSIYNNFNFRYIEFSGDKKGNITLLGTNNKETKTLINHNFYIPSYTKIPLNLINKYRNSINKYDKKFLSLKIKNTNEKNIEKLVKNVINDRTEWLILNKEINVNNIINESIYFFREKNNISKGVINDIITDKIHDYISSN